MPEPDEQTVLLPRRDILPDDAAMSASVAAAIQNHFAPSKAGEALRRFADGIGVKPEVLHSASASAATGLIKAMAVSPVMTWGAGDSQAGVGFRAQSKYHLARMTVTPQFSYKFNSRPEPRPRHNIALLRLLLPHLQYSTVSGSAPSNQPEWHKCANRALDQIIERGLTGAQANGDCVVLSGLVSPSLIASVRLVAACAIEAKAGHAYACGP